MKAIEIEDDLYAQLDEERLKRKCPTVSALIWYLLNKKAKRSALTAAGNLLELLDNCLKQGKHLDIALLSSSDKERLDDVLLTLTEREEKVIRLRCGIGDGYPRTVEEVEHVFNVSGEQVQKIETKAIRKLHHPTRSRKLKEIRIGKG